MIWIIYATIASKHGVIGYTKHIAAVYSKHGIKVNAICPGTIFYTNDRGNVKNETYG
ncbi:SDR family NAD(P)-dependent oxidoreductase [Domibacillus aminovorans]|uniref:SDR family NAD(P)-dependent oxidoreductase n=1 Tax=Domibacillus aminovorans TaxID=29332 RepID=UPI001B803250